MVFYNKGGIKKLMIGKFMLNIMNGKNVVNGHDEVISSLVAEDTDLSTAPFEAEKPKAEPVKNTKPKPEPVEEEPEVKEEKKEQDDPSKKKKKG